MDLDSQSALVKGQVALIQDGAGLFDREAGWRVLANLALLL